MTDKLTGRKILVQNIINLFPKSLRLMLNPDRYSIEKFVKFHSQKIKRGAKVLDAGAGPCPYKLFFSHCKYESTDFKKTSEYLDFVCSLDKIPKKSNNYDAILSTQVLEHVEYPQKVVNEFFRVLKKGGILLITVPQSYGLHQEPYNFYNFTKYGLESILRNAGFKKFIVSPRGGYFWFLATLIRENGLFSALFTRHKKLNAIVRIIESPLTRLFIPFFLFYLDYTDKEKKWTLGYSAVAIK